MILRRRFKKRIAFDDFIQQMRRNGWHIEGMGMDSKRYPYFVTMTKKEALVMKVDCPRCLELLDGEKVKQ